MPKPAKPAPAPAPAPVAPAPVAVYTKPAPVAPAVRKGTSTAPSPVGTAWALCVALTHANGGALCTRAAYMAAVQGAGVTYYTARTQVQAYTKWAKAGANPVGLPRGLAVAPGTLLAPPVANG